MTPKWTSALAAVIALALSGISPPSSAAESMDTAAAHQVYSHGAKADYLAGYHMQNKLTANCSACHPTDAVSDSQSEIDKNCTACHGTYDALGKKDHAAGKTINAHAGHLSIDSCTTCHGGHEASFSYCNNCHVFDMPMKFGRQKIAYEPQDLSIYKDAVPNRTEKADFVIVGGGGAGMAAAIDAARNGLNVVMLEKMPIIGGSSLLST